MGASLSELDISPETALSAAEIFQIYDAASRGRSKGIDNEDFKIGKRDSSGKLNSSNSQPYHE